MDNKQWDDMKSYVNQLKEEDKKKKIVDDKEFSDENHVDNNYVDDNHTDNNEFSDDTNENTNENNDDDDDSESCVSSMTSLEYEDLTSSTTSSVHDVVHDVEDPIRKQTEDQYFLKKEKKFFEFTHKFQQQILQKQNYKCNNFSGSPFELKFNYRCLLHQQWR